MGRRIEKVRPENLTCWKDIARHMGKSVRTVQRWERELGLPVRRPNHVNRKSSVIARRDDLDAWVRDAWRVRSPASSSSQ